VSCDGDRIVSEPSVLARMERQLTLERLGWNFIRLRASEYLVDESRAMRRVVRKLGSLKIEPMAGKQAEASSGVVREDLREKIFKRAEMIRSRWKVSAFNPVVATSGKFSTSVPPRRRSQNHRTAPSLAALIARKDDRAHSHVSGEFRQGKPGSGLGSRGRVGRNGRDTPCGTR